jgi:hypothetical protein
MVDVLPRVYCCYLRKYVLDQNATLVVPSGTTSVPADGFATSVQRYQRAGKTVPICCFRVHHMNIQGRSNKLKGHYL